MNYNDVLRDQIYALKATYAIDCDFEVDSEQAFLKKKDLKPGTIYVLTRELQNDNAPGVDTQPVQVLILSEQNSLELAKGFFGEFAKTYNFHAATYGGVWMKQQYSDPVVLSNFNTVNYGYRSVLYISATLFIMWDVADLKNLTVDGNSVLALAFDLSYSMGPNTQQLRDTGLYISRSVKSNATMAITMTVPVQESDLVSKVLGILSEQTDGNDDFTFSFSFGTHAFTGLKFKLTLAEFAASADNIPTIRLGFMR